MVSTCEEHFGFKVRVRGKSKFFVRMTKRALPKVRVKCSSSIKASFSMTLKLPDTLFGGNGNSSQNFGSSGDTVNTLPDFILPINFVQNFGGLLPRPMRMGSALKVRVTPVTIKRAITNVSPSIFDTTSAEYVQSGDAAIPDSVYIPASFNNSTGANNLGPKVYWGLRTSQVRTQNFKFRASAGVPVNNFKVKLRCEGKIRAKYFEKLHGFVDRINAKDDYVPTEKIVPIKDIEVASNTIAWVNETLESGNLYQSINEGVSVGNIVQNGKRGSIISDDDTTFITPSSIYTASKISYKCEVTRPSVNPIESYFFLRASAPIRTNESDVPPEYKISNIKYEDPSGNLIAKYKDFVVKGEQDYSLKDQYSFVTYISETDINYGAFNSWEYYHPILDEPDGYTLSFDIESDCHYKPFTKGFTEGFLDSCNIDEKFVPSSRNDYLALDGSPLSTHTDDYYLKPSDSIRISAIELANIGTSSRIFHDQKVHMLLKAPEKLTLVERIISPTQVLNSTYSNDIHPTNIISTWKSSADIDGNYYYNEDKKGKSTTELTDRLSNRYVEGDITLDDISPVADSGKLQLLYEHKKPFFVKIPQGGATNSAFVNNDFKVAQIEVVQQPDSFFVVEEIFLRIKAKKAVGTNDFSIDVVGYSDDDVTIKTPEVGGFLQNSEVGAGTIPEESGFYRIDELGISSFPSSEKSSYYQRPATDNPAGDHYKLTPSIYKVTKGSNNQETKTASLINSTSYAEYEVPLKIYKDKVELGSSLDYSMSTYFESLYLDIYPIPSGASISKADIIVKYSPAHALAMYTMGYDKKEIYKRDTGLIVSQQKSVDTLMNLSGVALSQLDNIPHAYSTKESTLKTNYSRRWRGSSGNLRSGAFDSTQFGYAFENPQATQPFTLGYYDVNKIKDDAILSSVVNTSLSGVFSHDGLSDSITKNIGMRFDSDHLFSNPVRSYKSIDWAYDGDPLHGKILDAFDNAVRVSGVDGYINFGNVPTASGFAIFTRFSPDVTISGVDYNLWNSGVLFQKQDSGQNLEYGLKYNNGSLQAFARDNVGNTISVEDTANYDEYQYPLSIAVTYNSGQNKKLKLYAANEIIGSGTSDWPILRGESSAFVMHSGDSDLTFGYSKNNGAGLNAFISEIGISDAHPVGGANLVDSNANASYQQDSIYDFFDGHVVKFWKDTDPTPLWKFVDEDTDTWNLGAFKYCEFGRDFSIMTHRSGKDFISHKIYNDNKTYDQITDLAIPSNINVSGLIYHTQIENDMLRFHLDGREDRYFSTPPRLVKDLPRGYLIDGDALEVNTVVQHFADNDIFWPDGNTGAKLIVSLYTPNKESVLSPSVNYGLINRSTHYLNPKDCWNKISSRLSLNDIKDDTSEPWAFFDKTITSKELKENYFARDIDQMFVQYDLLYPSGHYTESEIILHSVDVKLNEAILTEEVISDRVLLETSGDAFSTNLLNLETSGKDSVDDVMWITTSGDNYTGLSASGWLNTVGSGLGYEEFPLVTKGIASFWQTGSPAQSFPIFAGENFGSAEQHDPYRDYVKLYLPFDSNLNVVKDYSINNHSPSLLDSDTANGFTSLHPFLENKLYPESSTNSILVDSASPLLSTGKSANFVNSKDNLDNWNRSVVKYEGVQFDPTEADGDWIIDFWYYLYDTGDQVGYERPLGAWRNVVGFNAGIFGWGRWQRTEHGLNGAETKFVGMKLVWMNGILYFVFGLNSHGAEATPFPEGWTWRDHHSLFDSSEGLSPAGMAGNGDDLTTNNNPLDWVTYGSIGALNRPDRPNIPHYNTDFYGYEDIRNTWAKFIIRKIGTVIQIFVNEEKVAEADIGRWKFDYFDEVNYDPSFDIPDTNPFKLASTPSHGFLLDDFRITMGSARSTDINSNPTTSPDAVSNGLSISSPTASRDPRIEPPATTTTSAPVARGCPDFHLGTFDPDWGIYVSGCYNSITDTYNCTHLRMSVLGGLDTTGAKLGMSTISNNPDATPASGVLSLYAYDDQSATTSTTLALATYSDTYDEEFDVFGPIESPDERQLNASLNLFIRSPDKPLITKLDTSCNMFVDGRKPAETATSDLGLFLYHYAPIAKKEGELESFDWDGQNNGVPIELVDDGLSSVTADDNIRGVTTVCYGDCNSNANTKCFELPVITHDTLWYEPECATGGVARGLRTYSNPNDKAFGSDEPYNNHYYGMRKFQNLIPYALYDIVVHARTGSDKVADVPREIDTWEYGIKNASTGNDNENVNYSGISIIPPQNNIAQNQKFGSAIDVCDDMIFIGSPFENLEVGVTDLIASHRSKYPSTYELEECGKIYVYKKDPAPSGYDWSDQSDKSGYQLHQEIVIPKHLRRDTFTTERKTFENIDDFEGVVSNWQNLGEGRRLGSSIATSKINNKKILATGGTGSKWSRTFDTISPSPVKIGMFVFNNEIEANPRDVTWTKIVDELKNRDLLYRYFCDPSVEFSIKVILLEPLLGGNFAPEAMDEFDYPQPDFVTSHLVHRHFDTNPSSVGYQDREDIMFNELKEIFHEEFPLSSTELNSGIPALMGIYIDDSRSLGKAAVGAPTDFRRNAIGRFQDYYNQYGYDNGLEYRSSNQMGGGGPAYGYSKVTIDTDEDWITQSINCLQDLTTVDNLKDTNTFRIFADSLGTFNSEADEFNNPPPSGGAVYIFEEDDNNQFNLIQYLPSPTTNTENPSDRFGHSVAFSDDGKILAVGSPYCESPFRVYQYNEFFSASIQSHLKSSTLTERFLKKRRDYEVDTLGVFEEGYNLYTEFLSLSGSTARDVLNQSMYDKFSDSMKFLFLEEHDITPYKLIKDVSYSSTVRGGWGSLYSRYVPTSRIGYSVDVNKDGSLIAVGCPTDSLGERDDLITWFRYDFYSATSYGGQNWQWQNYTNAGCVRLYESRDYYPHDRKVVEYYKFGNLHEIIETEENGVDPQYFTQAMKTLYNAEGYSFERTSFSEDKEIPEDAGLAFIITPSVNAGSSEVINNIRNWLALGDRHLVLVGNDPRWEASGRYAVGNDILNSILGQLDIKMRLYAARNEIEALMTNELYYNVRTSFVPGKTMDPIADSRVVMRGSGVADIRFYDEGKSDLYSCQMPPNRRNMSDPFSILENVDGLSASDAGRKQTYRELHSRCQLPIIHEGDLRAEYTDQCVYRDCRGNASFVNYNHNLAYMFGSHTTASWGCTVCDEPPIFPVPINERSFSEPIPILSTWETVSRTYTTDAVPAYEDKRKVLLGYNYTSSSYKEFGDAPYDSGIDFAWTATSGDPVIDYNVTNVNSDSLFFDPESYNGRDGLLMAGSTSIGRSTDTVVYVTDSFVLAAEENLGSSKVYLIASNLFQDRDFNVMSPNDELIDFYFNILANDQFGSSRVAQLGGFTNRSSYKEGYAQSSIEGLMGSLNISMEDLNVDPHLLRSAATPYDVAWITNTIEYPSAEDIESLKIFLSNPSKKLIITYGEHPNKEFEGESKDLTNYMVQAANVASHICSELGLDMKPLYLPSKNRLASYEDTNRATTFPDGQRATLYIDRDSSVARGLGIQSTFPANPQGEDGPEDYYSPISLPPYVGRFRTGRGFYHNAVPIDTGSKARRIAYLSEGVRDSAVIEDAYPQFYSGLTKVTFQIPEPKSYHDDYNVFRIFLGYSSESKVEINPIEFWITNCNTLSPIEPEDFATSDSVGSWTIPVPFPGGVVEYSDKIGVNGFLSKRGSALNEKFVDVQFPSGESEFSIYFKAYSIKPNAELSSNYSTNRLFHVSGARVPVVTVTDTGKVPIYGFETFEVPGIPSQTVEVTRLREVSTDSSKYCIEANSPECLLDKPVGYGSPANEIADGPVVMAQQVYHQAGYLAGDNKSRVTVIADASLIQGDTITVEGSNRFNSSVGKLLRSLYPVSPRATRTFGYYDDDDDRSTFRAQKRYELSYKIVSPERSSPSRLINAYPDNSGLNYRFGEHDSNSLNSSYFSDDEGKKRIIPNPGNDFVSQPFDGMLALLSAEDTGKFRKLPEAPRLSPSERFAQMEPKPEAGIAAQKALEQAWYVDNFKIVEQFYGSNSKLTDTYKGVTYSDAGYLQIIPDIMKDHDIDHLDLDVFISGYPGDLFGYCVKIDNNDNVYASSPFTPYSGINTVSWDKIRSNSPTYGQEVGYNGGAGAVYVLKRQGVGGNGAGSIIGSKVETTGIPWEVTSKIRPEEIKVGFTNIDSTNSVSLIGPNSYSDDFLKSYAFVPDMFGADISIEGDVLSISAPGHDFDVVPEEKPGAFVRKEFNNQFNIGTRVNHDLATPSGFNEYATSGTSVVNNGAVFTYENKIDDWGAKTQNWVKVQKLVYGEGRVQGSGENLFAGQDIAMDRARRTDADYILAFNATNHLVNGLDNVGSVYTNDAMLRKLRPSFAHPETYISGRVFGDFNSDADIVNFKLANGSETNKLYKYEGRILATQKGEVFIEVSGQDKIDKGYVIHRPYVEKVEGAYAFGISEFEELPLFVEGKAPSVSGNLNLVTSGDNLATYMPTDTNNVYNSLLEEDIQNNPDGVVFLVSRGGRPKK